MNLGKYLKLILSFYITDCILGRELEITSIGFQFLLLNRVEQIWTYLIYYMKFLTEKNVDIFPLLEFFFQLLLTVSKKG